MSNFSDLLQTAKTSSTVSATTVASVNSNDTGIAMASVVENDITALAYEPTPIAENWIKITDRYQWYDDFDDEHISTIDERKNIKLDENQVNLSQEELSQFIPFEMNRRYDNFDIALNTRIQFHYVSSNGYEDYISAINVKYNDEKIRFALLVPYNMTATAGKIDFEIIATGTNSKGENYKWISRACNKLTVIKSLSGNGIIDPTTSDWYTQFIRDMDAKLLKAEQYAQDAKASADSIDEETIANNVYNKVETTLLNYYTKTEVDKLFEDFDISDQLVDITDRVSDLENEFESFDGLANLDIRYNNSTQTLSFYNGDVLIKDIVLDMTPSVNWVTAYDARVDSKISTALTPIQEDLNTYKDKTDADLLSIHENIDNLPTTLETNYYTIERTDELLNEKADKTTLNNLSTKVSSIESSVESNKTGITTIGTKVGELETVIGNIDKSPKLSYRTTYNAEDGTFSLREYEGDEIDSAGEEDDKGDIVSQFKIVGGSGGSGTNSVLKIEYLTKTPLVVTIDDSALITFNFSGTDSSGDAVLEGQASWKVAGTTVTTSTVVAGENTFDITKYITTGTQKVTLSVTDDAGSLVTKSWTVQKVDVRIESSFNDTYTYPIGTVSFDYTPYGAISKDVHFLIDGKEIGKVTTASSGIPMGYTLPSQSHGSHLVEVYMTADINNNTIESNHIVKDIMWYDASTPVISCAKQKFKARQYDNTNITFTVIDPSTEMPTVVLAVDGVVQSTLTLESNTHTWQYKSSDIGEHILTITCGNVVKTLYATIEKLDINIEPVTAGLVFDFNPSGKSNNDADRLWSYGDTDIGMTVSDNFDWINGGYQLDEHGDQYFCVKAGTSAEINYHLFADDAKKNGKEMKLVFRTTNVAKPDATFLHCMDNTTGSDHIGIQMDVHEANIYGQSGKLELSYSEDDIIEFEFNINKSDTTNGNIPMVMGYEDGVSTRPMVYDDSYNFTQNSPKIISLGSEDCDLHIYRFKVYNTSLTDKGILNNFIADARNAEEMVSRYERNQIYDENQNLDPDVLAKKCPWLRVYKLSAPYFTNNKSDKVPYTTIQQIYKDGDPILDNWTCYDCSHSGQGTSSNNYGAAGRNLDFIMNKSQRDGVEPYFVLGDGSQTDKITLTRTSVPVAYLNAKVNIASSNNMTNAMLAGRYNEFKPYSRPFVRDEGVDTSFIKDTMEFANCVIFIQETNEDLTTHREFADNNWHFYAIGNIGDSKKSDKTRLTDMDDKYECCIEIMDVELPLSDFPTDTMYNAMGYKEDEVTHERTYIWAKNENLGILYEKINGEYVLTSDTEVDLNKIYYVDILEHDDFSEDYTYGWRYLYEGDDDEENAEVFDYCKQRWIEAYRFITTSTDEEFKAHIGDYFNLDTVLYYYLFTTRYCMVDNRAKNCFIHYAKTGEVDTDGNPIRKFHLDWGYDMDTACGLNNYGKQVYRYGLEDTDVDEKGEEVFRESDSQFFCRIRDLFSNELKAMYQTLESKNAWHAESFINKADEWQSQFPEELWRLDIERKYLRTYNSSFIDGKGDDQFLKNMANGKMKYHRRQWERNQEQYMASKYQSNTASSDDNSVVMRCTAPSGDLVIQPNYKLKLTPYAYMYLNVEYSTGVVQIKAEPNIEYEIPFTGDKTDIIKVYSASCIQSLGDLSSCYLATISTGTAGKLKELTIGNSTDGYDNPYFTTLTTGANYLLEKLNVENVSGLTQSLNLSALSNLRELYAHGSNASGVTFANGGKIEIAELPAITSVIMKNLIYLTAFDIADFSKLTSIAVENCNTVDLITILNSATNINRVRITGINWELNDTTLLERLYDMKGFDKDGYNTDKSVLTGKVHVPVIKQQQLYDYKQAWSDLEITFNTMIEQYAVTFKNDDGSVLTVQYVDKGSNAVDPIENGDIDIPTKESTVSTDFTFAGWDSVLTGIFEPRTITATYSESTRSYTVKYVSKGITLQESTGLYGENIIYEGSIPTYTAEEEAFKYYLFNRWDKSGVVDGNKTINAIFDEFAYTTSAFDGKELNDLTPVEIYALSKFGLDKTSMDIQVLDTYNFTMGYDVDYDDIESELLISEKKSFVGTNYYDTGVKLFDEDKDFTLAIDYKFGSDNSANAVLAQCFQSNGSNGFKLWYSNGIKATWGTASITPTTINKREMIVIRHKKGEATIKVYNSNLDSTEISISDLTKTTLLHDGTLVFGCARQDDGAYENYAIGDIYWAKVWYMDLGDKTCQKLVGWTHENITLEVSGFKRYYLSQNPSKRCMFTLLAKHLLERNRPYNTTNTNVGGWAESNLNKVLNTRMYEAMPHQIQSLTQQVTIYSSIGAQSKELSASQCYISIPAVIEVDAGMNTDPYVSEDTTIAYMTSQDMRKRAYDNGDYEQYWLRSPNVANATQYVYYVSKDGSLSGYSTPSTKNGILIEISF